MGNELFKPDIEVNPNLDQRVLCRQQLDEVDLDTGSGGCYGVSCDRCILDSSEITAFYKWIRGDNTGQHSIFE